jgi:hypothetical protein
MGPFSMEASADLTTLLSVHVHSHSPNVVCDSEISSTGWQNTFPRLFAVAGQNNRDTIQPPSAGCELLWHKKSLQLLRISVGVEHRIHPRYRLHASVTFLSPVVPKRAWDANVRSADENESTVKGRPISGVLGTADVCTHSGPARYVSRPAWTLAANAPAMSTGSKRGI